LFIVPGLTSDAQSGYIKNIVTEAHSRKYNVVVINYRGLYGTELSTPKLYNCFAVDDVLEPMEAVIKRYEPKKVFAIGCSMGSNILANLMGILGEKTFVNAAVMINGPMDNVKNTENLR
jgi:predicted alpha/beta-fold hydrolase